MSKRLLCAVVCLVLMVSCLGCQPGSTKEPADLTGSEAEEWMPFGLKFGMSYEEFSATLQECGVVVPQLEAATSNAGYVAGPVYMSTHEPIYWDFLNSEDLSALAQTGNPEDLELSLYKVDLILAKPVINFSFNENKELYEFGLMWSVSDLESDFNQWFVGELVTAYDAKFGVQSDAAFWETDTMGGSVQSYDNDGGKLVVLVLHSKTYELGK